MLTECTFLLPAKKQDTSVSKTGFYFDTVIKSLYDADAEPELESCFCSCRQVWKLLSATKKGSISGISTMQRKTGSSPQKKLFPCFKSHWLQRALMVPLISRSANSLLFGILESQIDTVPSQKTLMPHFLTVDYHNIEISDNTVTLKNPKTQIDLGGIAKRLHCRSDEGTTSVQMALPRGSLILVMC